ncbi:hypothetical protein HY989_02510 [Candidatus Micrarchaeota archaeon]|nr:hypothetical protein [Candidatus Micrarchaeota archaeon]
MTVKGDGIVQNCRNCYANSGFGIKLINDGGSFNCPHCKTRYAMDHGFTRRL